MKSALLFLTPLLIGYTGTAQPDISSLPTVIIQLKNADEPPAAGGVFSHFEVIDERPDTARIGIHDFSPILGHSRNRQLVFPHATAEEIAAYLNSRFARPGAPYSAFIVLRTLWLYDANYLREERVKNPDILYDRTHIHLKAEIYAVKDSLFIPVLRFDSLQVYKRANPYNNLNTYYSLWDKDLADMLNEMATEASDRAQEHAEKSRRLRFDEVRQFNRTRFDAPINSAAALAPGVYASFAEFKNNAPSTEDFEIRMEKKNRVLYLKGPNGNSYYSHDAWGYSDGKMCYIMRDGLLLPLVRTNNAYYFLGEAYKEEITEGYQDPTTYLSSGSDTARSFPVLSAPEPDSKLNPRGRMRPDGTSRPPLLQQRIYTVDMDSGKVY